MSDDEIRFIGDMQRLQLEPDDVFVLQTDGDLSMEVIARLREQLGTALGGRKVIVLTNGLRLGVMSAREIIE